MADLLRSEEILACAHRVALNRGRPFDFVAPETSAELARRQRDAEQHRLGTLEEIASFHLEAVTPSSSDDTIELMREGAELLLASSAAERHEGPPASRGAPAGARGARGRTFRLRTNPHKEQRDHRTDEHPSVARRIAHPSPTQRGDVHRRLRPAQHAHRHAKRYRPRPRDQGPPGARTR